VIHVAIREGDFVYLEATESGEPPDCARVAGMGCPSGTGDS
jgi:hypothetical protein